MVSQDFKVQCPDGLYFDPSITACNWAEQLSDPDKAKCNAPTTKAGADRYLF